MSLPKVKNKKLIEKKSFAKVAREVKESFDQEAQYLFEKKLKDGHTLSSQSYSAS